MLPLSGLHIFFYYFIRTYAAAAGKELIQALDIEKYFHYKEIYPGCKLNHFQK